MQVLFLSSEVAPFSKTGGLGDVAGALPSALAALGHQVLVVTPLYLGVPREGLEDAGALTLTFPFGPVTARLRQRPGGDGLTHVFVDVPPFFERPGLYGHPDDARRFAAFTMAGLSHAQARGFLPDVVHANDWPAGLAALALKRGYAHTPLGNARTVFTIHNLAYQGNFPKSELEALGLPWSLYTVDGVEFYDQLSFMKAALKSFDVLTTVSPSYAKEIQTPLGGHGLDGVLRARSKELSGILNGVDVREWNPATDVLLPARFTSMELSGKARCRQALLDAYGLDAPPDGQPIFGMVGRMVEQKGVDLLLDTVPRVLEQGARAVVLGSGEPAFEARWRQLAQRFPTRLGVKVGFDNALAHLIEAGSDFFLMPSRFEPCGLNQMYSLLYGAVPVVRDVGGLKDTVVDVAQPQGTGLVFSELTSAGLSRALLRALDLFRRPDEYRQVQRRGMAQDFSWQRSARAYEALYRTR
ncbi:MAG: glycogen synthase GlgA [Myxococcales bacterium]|nr:glycogen synthase GlgA [Myxococcales bacterium]